MKSPRDSGNLSRSNTPRG